MLEKDLERLLIVTNIMAEELDLIRKRMPGRGINPRESLTVEAKLFELSNKLRMLGADKDNPVPF